MEISLPGYTSHSLYILNIFSVNVFHIFTIKCLLLILMFLFFEIEIDGLKNVKSTKFEPFHN